MNANGGDRNRWRVALGGLVLVVATSNCSVWLAHSGVSSVSEIEKPETRAEVREAFGKADETGTCPDGRIVELRSIRRKVPAVCEGQTINLTDGTGRCDWLGWTYLWTLGLADVFVLPVIAQRSEKAKFHYVFVYGPDGHVLSRYQAFFLPSDLCPLQIQDVP